MMIRDLVLNFRAALLGIVPSADRVQLAWKRPDAYDSWDNIATALYQSLVVEPIRWAVAAEGPDDFKMAEYDLLLASYRHVAFLEVLPPAPRSVGARVFCALGTRDQPFDTVECRLVSPAGHPLTDELEEIDLQAVDFLLRNPNSGLTLRTIKSISLSVTGDSGHGEPGP